MFVVNKNPNAAELRKFGWAMLVGFGVIGALIWWLNAWTQHASIGGWTGTWRQIAVLCLWGLGFALWVLSKTSPDLTRRVYVAWMTATIPIGIIMSTVLLTLMFFLLLPVFALIVRSRDPLRRKLIKHGTYWEDYPKFEPTLERMKRLF